jgi:hypothetical protein
MNRFLVIVYPPRPKNSGNAWTRDAPNVQWVRAESPQRAAEAAHVQPGGHALVTPEPDVCRFDRPAQASLQERLPNGSLISVETAA